MRVMPLQSGLVNCHTVSCVMACLCAAILVSSCRSL